MARRFVSIVLILFVLAAAGYAILHIPHSQTQSPALSADGPTDGEAPAASSTGSTITDNGTTNPPPTTAPPSIVRAPDNSQFGVSLGTTLLGLNASQRNAELNDLASLGVGWIRIDFDWSGIQSKNSSSFSWNTYDAVVSDLIAHNFNILGIIGYTPQWARPDTCTRSVRCAPQDPEDFAVFAAKVVSRYHNLGLRSWEIWNEPNSAGFWQPSANAGDYAALLKAAYTAIKAVDPDAVVITGGLSPSATTETNIAPVTFLSRLYDNGAGDSFDAVGFHPYSYPAMPSLYESWNAWSQMSQTPTSLRSVMTAHGDGGKRIWMTEYGAPTGGPGLIEDDIHDTVFAGGPEKVTEDVQAAMIAKAVSLRNSYSWAGPLFIYSYKDLGTSQTTWENFFGMVRYDGSHKPAYEAFYNSIH